MEKIYTIVQKAEHVIEVHAESRKEAHEKVNRKEGTCIDTAVRAQYITGVRSTDGLSRPETTKDQG